VSAELKASRAELAALEEMVEGVDDPMTWGAMWLALSVEGSDTQTSGESD
jgi:hypothetical protein